MEYEIAILCLVLFCAAYKIGRVGYEIEKKIERNLIMIR